jgi:hypothetical protein
MARSNEASPEANEYVNKVTGETAGAYVGTEQDKVYASDPDFEPVGERSTAVETPAEEPVPDEKTGKSRSEGGRLHESELKDKSRDELNTLAAEAGVENPEGFANKGEVITAILETSAAVETPAEEG